MTLPAVSSFLDTLRHMQLVPTARLEELARDGRQFPESRALARHLVERGWLTPYQVNHLLQERGTELVLGSYVIQERLGEGTRGQVFKARHQIMKRVVALKVIRKKLLADEGAVERFYLEVEGASKLAHGNIVHAYDAGPIGPTHFLAMEYVEGTDLRQLVEKCGPLPIDQACSYVAQAALGLQHAHERGLLHRDICPENLHVTGPPLSGAVDAVDGPAAPGVIKIMDFGQGQLGRRADGDSSDSDAENKGACRDYLAPEQVLGGHVDARADIYSLGCTFYFLLTGRPPFPGGPFRTTERDPQWRPLTPVEEWCADLPAEVVDVLQRMMAATPQERYASAAEVVAALMEAVPGGLDLPPAPGARPDGTAEEAIDDTQLGVVKPTLTPEPMPAKPRRRRFLLAFLGGAAALALLAWAGFALFAPGSVAPSPDGGATEPDTAEAILKRLSARAANPGADADDLWNGLVQLRTRFPGTPEAGAAAALMARVPSPLGQLTADKFAGMESHASFFVPKDTVAALGDPRWRQWSHGARCLAYSPNGHILASSGDGGLIYLWDAATGKLLSPPRNHGAGVNGLAFSPDSKTIASAGTDKQVKLWDVAAAANPTVLQGHGENVLCVAYASNGKYLASGCKDGNTRVWELAKKQTIASYGDANNRVSAIAFSADGGTVISACGDESIKWWSMGDKKLRHIAAKTHKGGVRMLAVASKPSNVVASAGPDKALKLWDADTGAEIAAIKLPAEKTSALAFSPDGKALASCGEDRVPRLWDPATRKSKGTQPALNYTVHALAFSPDGRVLAGGCAEWDPSIHFWNLDTPASAGSVSTPPRNPRALAFAPDGRTLFGGAAKTSPIAWDVLSAQEKYAPAEKVSTHFLALAPDGQTLATASTNDKLVRLWDASSGKGKAILAGHPAAVSALAYSPDGKTLASCGHGNNEKDRAIRLWDTADNKPRAALTLGKQEKPYTCAAFAPDGLMLAAGNGDDGLRLWEASIGKEGVVSIGLNAWILALAYSPDGKYLVVGGQDRQVRFLDPATGKPRTEPALPLAANVTALAFTPDSQMLIAVSADQRVTVWKLATRAKWAEWTFPGPIHGVAPAPDSRHLATANGNGTAFVLRLPSVPPRK